MLPQIAQFLGPEFSEEKFKAEGNMFAYNLEPLLDIHLKSALMGELEANFDITYVYLFLAIASFILIIACINFMNLSTARSANRAKEVGIRKVMGSFRSHLMRQFLSESILLSVVSFVLATALAYLINRLGIATLRDALVLAVVVWGGFQVAGLVGSVLHEGYPITLYAIHMGDALAKVAASCLIITGLTSRFA